MRLFMFVKYSTSTWRRRVKPIWALKDSWGIVHQFLSLYQAMWGTEENRGPPLVLGPSPSDFPHCSLKGAEAWESHTNWNNVSVIALLRVNNTKWAPAALHAHVALPKMTASLRLACYLGLLEYFSKFGLDGASWETRAEKLSLPDVVQSAC